MKFNLGVVTMSEGIVEILNKGVLNSNELYLALNQYQSGEWGITIEEECKCNDVAITRGWDVKAKYKIRDTEFLITTEWDRSVTTILLEKEI